MCNSDTFSLLQLFPLVGCCAYEAEKRTCLPNDIINELWAMNRIMAPGMTAGYRGEIDQDFEHCV